MLSHATKQKCLAGITKCKKTPVRRVSASKKTLALVAASQNKAVLITSKPRIHDEVDDEDDDDENDDEDENDDDNVAVVGQVIDLQNDQDEEGERDQLQATYLPQEPVPGPSRVVEERRMTRSSTPHKSYRFFF